jgi:hypothetical protein
MDLDDLEIPQLVTRPAPHPIRSAKPGPAAPSTRFSSLPPVVRWTRYGYWSDDGLTVHNEHGAIIYRAGQVLQSFAARKLKAARRLG